MLDGGFESSIEWQASLITNQLLNVLLVGGEFRGLVSGQRNEANKSTA